MKIYYHPARKLLGWIPRKHLDVKLRASESSFVPKMTIQPFNLKFEYDPTTSPAPFFWLYVPRWSRDRKLRERKENQLFFTCNYALTNDLYFYFNNLEFGDGGDWLDAFILRWQGDTPILLLTNIPRVLRKIYFIENWGDKYWQAKSTFRKMAAYLWDYQFVEYNNHASWLAYNMLLYGEIFNIEKYKQYGHELYLECLKQVKEDGSQPLEEKRRPDAVGHYCQMNLEALILCHQALYGRGGELPDNIKNAIQRLPDWSFIKHPENFNGLPEGGHVMYVEKGELK